MPAQLSRHHQPDFEHDLLTQLAQRWGRRAVIKQDELDLDGHYDPALPDFPERLVLTAFYALDFDPWVPVAQAGGLDIEAGQIADLMSSRPTPARDTGTLQQLLRQLGIREELFRPPVAQRRN